LGRFIEVPYELDGVVLPFIFQLAEFGNDIAILDETYGWLK